MPVRDRELLAASVRVGLAMLARDGFDALTLTGIAERVELTGDKTVSERTLRRRYGSPARLLFGTPWWLPDPYDAIGAVLAPRPDRTEAPVWPSGPEAEAASLAGIDLDGDRGDFDWPPAEFFTRAGIPDPLGDVPSHSPEPISLRDFLQDLHVVLTGHLVATGFAACLALVEESRREHAEVDAWLARSEAMWADRLTDPLARLFGFAPTTAAVAAHAFRAATRALDPALADLARAIGGARRNRPGAARAAAEAEDALLAARSAAFDQLGTVLSEPDGIRVRAGRGTVEPGGRYGALPTRPPAAGAAG
ncbi:hypothetical protein [Tsukamurella sp. 1534]|uniref:hypothetical protein n=1 Tax=Tsukamurella sp. 1534 TaxID=1151061 RepID=UPI0003018776|nr:hypothetical protein [Tsukamurella sp. 1534]